jgi:hypothetical protein
MTRFGETDPTWSADRIDPIAPSVNHHVMVEPAESGQIVRVGWPAFGPRPFVMGLESVSAGAPFGGATAIPVENESLEPPGDDPGTTAHRQRLAVDVPDQLEVADASHLVKDLGPYRRSGLGLGSVGIDEHGDQRSAADARPTVFANLGEGHSPPITKPRTLPFRQ